MSDSKHLYKIRYRRYGWSYATQRVFLNERAARRFYYNLTKLNYDLEPIAEIWVWKYKLSKPEPIRGWDGYDR